MKVVMLNGQNHKGSSYHIGKEIFNKLPGENEIKEFFFPRDLNHFCLGCYSCIEDMAACPFYSEKEMIIKAVDEAELLIVTTPTYCMHMSASLKAFFDLTFDLWMSHRPLQSMFTKRAVIISTSAGSSTKSALKDVEDCLFYMGVPEIIKYGIAVQAMNWDGVSEKKKQRIVKDTEKIAGKLSKKNKPAVHIKTRLIFKMMRLIQKKGWNSSPVETQYWKEKGWLDGKKPWKGYKINNTEGINVRLL